MCVARHSQRNQSNKFTTSLQYLKENVKVEVPAENHKRFLQIDTIILGVWPGMPSLPKITSLLLLCNILRKKWVTKLIFCMQISVKLSYKLTLSFWWRWSSIPNVPKEASLQCFYNISKRELEMKLVFCMQIKIQVFFKLISTLWALKFPSKWYYHSRRYYYWWARLGILKVLKVTSLQYLYNISRKELGMEFIFCMQINIKVSTSWSSILVFEFVLIILLLQACKLPFRVFTISAFLENSQNFFE